MTAPSTGAEAYDGLRAEEARLLAQLEAWHHRQVFPEPAGSPRCLLVLPREPLSVRIARIQASAMCWDRPGIDVADVALVTGTMVADAIAHQTPALGAPDTVTVAMILTERTLRIEVGALEPGRPVPLPGQRATGAPPGRETTLVDALCDRHGVRPFTGGTITWAHWDLP